MQVLLHKTFCGSRRYTEFSFYFSPFRTRVTAHKSRKLLLRGLSRSKFWGGSKLSQRSFMAPTCPVSFFPPEAETVSPLHFQSKDACILSDCVSALQSYGFIWQGLKCRSNCFISIQIFFQLDRDQKVVSSVSENGLEYKYRRAGAGGVRFPSLALLWCHDLNHSLAWMMIWPRDFLCSCLVCGKT